MSKSSRSLSLVLRVVILALVVLLLLSGVFLFVLIFFIPVVGWMLWRDQDRISRLEKKLAALEKPQEPQPEKS
ncbi:MAG: hypothetical protein KGI38_08845 [Thaumarchaeota archaeon]|nr:hypothetical protein [Nitrososphaerota archaeon]